MSSQQLYLSLKKLTKVLAEKESPLLAYLGSGVDKNYINSLIEPYFIKFSEELFTYYGWQNGFTNSPGEFIPMATVRLFTLGNPIPIETSLEVYMHYSFINGYWDKKYFPIFESGAGDHFLIDLDENSPTYNMVMFFSPSNPYFEGVISFSDSFLSLINTIIECYEKNYYYFDDSMGDRIFNEMPIESFEIWKQKNPKSEYWSTLEDFS